MTEEPSDFLAMLRGFDWLKVPGAVRAVSQLVTGTAAAGSAWIAVGAAKGKQVQQSIDDETNARSIVTKALIKAAVVDAAHDPDLAERAVASWVGDRLRKQKNKEAVIRLALEDLRDGPAIQVDTPAPDEDWLNVFGPYSESASSERLRETWARVLAGEIRKPGSFSLRTLLLVAVLDQNLANDIQNVTGSLVNGQFILLGGSSTGPEAESIIHLSDVGFLTLNVNQTWTSTEICQEFEISIGPTTTYIFRGMPGRDLTLPGVSISIAGLQLLSAITLTENTEGVSGVLKVLAGQFGLVQVGQRQSLPER